MFMREDEVHDRKDRFLDLTGISASSDEDDFFTHINNRKVMLTSTISLGIGMKSWSTDDRSCRSIFCFCMYKHIVDKEIRSRIFTDATNAHLVTIIMTCGDITHIYFFISEIMDDTIMEEIECVNIERLVDVISTYSISRELIEDDIFIFR